MIGRTTADAEAQHPGSFSFRSVSQTEALPGRRAEIWKQRLIILILIFSDILLALLIWEAALALQSIWGRGPLSGIMAASVVPSMAIWVGLRALLGLYPGYGLDQVEELRRQTYALLSTLAIVATFAFTVQVGHLLSRLSLGLGFVGLLLLAPLVRQFVKWQMMRAGLWGKPVVILSSGRVGERILKLLNREWGLGYKPVAVFSGRPTSAREKFECVPDERSLAEATNLSQRHGVDTAIFAMPHIRRRRVAELVAWASINFPNVTVIPNLEGMTNSAVTARDFAGTFGVEIRHNLLNPWSRRIKRTLDLFGAVAGGLAISPLLVGIAILIKLDSTGPVFYGHHRLGAQGKRFRCWKFRTMHTHAERLFDECLRSDPDLRAEWEQNHKLRNDPRVTSIGRFLRKTSLDELPQLWNVLRGEMSLIGPRPIVDTEVNKYGKIYELYKRIRPGISGLWQVSGRNDTSYATRIGMDSYYVRNWSVWLDLVILARTVRSVLFSRGAY